MLSNMNISVLVKEDEWAQFRESPLFTHACRAAFACGDPGILVQRKNESNKSTSPCGELLARTVRSMYVGQRQCS